MSCSLSCTSEGRGCYEGKSKICWTSKQEYKRVCTGIHNITEKSPLEPPRRHGIMSLGINARMWYMSYRARSHDQLLQTVSLTTSSCETTLVNPSVEDALDAHAGERSKARETPSADLTRAQLTPPTNHRLMTHQVAYFHASISRSATARKIPICLLAIFSLFRNLAINH